MGKPKEFDEKKFDKRKVLEYETDFYIFNLDQGLCSISLPMKAIRKTDWNKETKLKVRIEEVKA